ncbi:unnamed protein product [Peniophora sp. CBMAI 1063]|nr:unnamed protein product [Peniophora sp. CBMAI 1063]
MPDTAGKALGRKRKRGEDPEEVASSLSETRYPRRCRARVGSGNSSSGTLYTSLPAPVPLSPSLSPSVCSRPYSTSIPSAIYPADGAVDSHEEPLALSNHDARLADEVLQLIDSGKSAFALFTRSKEIEHIERAMDAQQRAVDLLHEDHPRRLELLHDLNRFAQARFVRQIAKLEHRDMERLVVIRGRIAELPSKGASERVVLRLIQFATSLWSQFGRFGRLEDLQDAIILEKRVLGLTPEDHTEWPERLRNLAISLHTRYERLGELKDLEDAIATKRLVLDLTPEDHSERPERLRNLAISQKTRFLRLGDLRDLENAIAAHRLVLDLTPEDHAKRPERLRSLAISLHTRYERLGELKDLENTITTERLVLDLTPEDHSERPERLRGLAISLKTRFERLGELKNLEDAIAAHRLVLDLTPENHSERPRRLRALAISLHTRYKRLGELGDLEDAIAAHRLVLDLTPENHSERPERLRSLAISLHTRYGRLGELKDLENTIATERLVLDLTPEDHSERPERLGGLAISLHTRYERLGGLKDLEDTIATNRLVLDLTPEDHSRRPKRLRSLAISLHTRYKRLGELKDLEDAIVAHRLVLDLTPEDHAKRAERLRDLAISLKTRFERLGELKDVEDAIAANELVLGLTPEGHLDSVKRLYDTGLALKLRFIRMQSKVNFDSALVYFMKATSLSLGPPSIRLDSALECISLLSEYPEFGSTESLLDAHAHIIRIFPEIVWLGHGIDRRLEESARLGNMVNAAVAAFIESRSRYQAIEWMEIGRSLVWSQLLSLREPLDALKEKHPRLAADLEKVSLELQHSTNESRSTSRNPHGSDSQMHDAANALHSINNAIWTNITAVTAEDNHRALAIQYDDLLKEVRRKDGFQNFLRSPSLISRMSDIEGLDGPVVFINVHTACDALALSPTGSVRHVPLPGLTVDGARNLRSAWGKVLQSRTVRGVISVDGLLSLGRANIFEIVLWKIWTWIVRPVLQALNFMDRPSEGHLPHITWCPTGPVTQLPLHAAGVYDPTHPTRSQRAFDYVVSTYTPSLSALLRSRKDLSTASNDEPKVLVVAQPETPYHTSLPHTRHEHERLGAVLSGSEPTALIGADGTVERTVTEMRSHSWVHFACHGYQRAKDPLQSAFALDDGPLTLLKLMGTTAKDAELAFLSACQTAVGDENNPEESMHLAAGMLAVGFKGVVATMWSIEDRDAPIIVEAYYKKLLELRRTGAVAKGCTSAAYALHEAARVLREHVGERNFVRWAPFVHFGV